MQSKQCPNGHFYDASKYSECPECKKLQQGGNATVKVDEDFKTQAIQNDFNTVKVDYDSTVNVNQQMNTSNKPTDYSFEPINNVNLFAGDDNIPMTDYSAGDGNKTVAFYKRTMGVNPVVGWLVCIEGPNFGEDFRIVAGRNFVGRSREMNICISKDNAVSRDKHAVIAYEPKKNIYLVQPGDSKELFYLNDDVVLSPMQMKANDILEIGESKMMFIPCCSELFTWKKKED